MMASDPLAAHAFGAAGVPAITWAAQAGSVILANAFGAGLAETPTLVPYLAAAARLLLGEELLLDGVDDRDELATAPCLASDPTQGLIAGRVVLRIQVA